MSLEQLIEKCQKKDIKAQGQLYKLYADKLFSVSLKYSRNKAEAQDNLQDAFLTIFKNIQQYAHKGSFEGWLKRITVNTVLQKYRKQTMFEIVDESAIKDTQVEIEEEHIELDFLLHCIQQLPDRYRLIFNLYVLDGYSHKAIAKMLKISDGTSKSNLARARQILKKKIEDFQSNEAKSQ